MKKELRELLSLTSAEAWAAWLRQPETRAFMQYIANRRQDVLQTLGDTDFQVRPSLVLNHLLEVTLEEISSDATPE